MVQLNDALPVLNVLQRAGHESYIVGGAVRNYLLELPIHDIDITTQAVPEEVIRLFEQTIPVGIEHGTVIVLFDGQPFEVTTFRTDGTYQDYRRPDQVIFVDNLKEDLIRRDFTINALAMDEQFNVVDYVDGKADIQLKLIRAVGLPAQRFQEDALRMLRAARFQSVLDFEIESETLKAITDYHMLLEYVAVERIVAELTKLLAGLRPDKGLKTLTISGLMRYIPMISGEVLPMSPVTLESYLGYVLYLEGDHGLSKLKLSNRQLSDIKRLAAIYEQLFRQNINVNVLVYRYSAEMIQTAVDFLTAVEIKPLFAVDPHMVAAQLSIRSLADLAVDGRKLMQHFNKQGGPWIKDVLTLLETHVVNGHLENQQYNLLKWVENNVEI